MKRLVSWANGSVAQVFSAEEPDGLREAALRCAAWCDELAKWKQAEHVWQMLTFALRLGDNPVAVVTTTPRPIAIVKRLLADPGHGRLTCCHNSQCRPFGRVLSQGRDGPLCRHAAGAVQELDGELIEDDPDALFRRDDIERLRAPRRRT